LVRVRVEAFESIVILLNYHCTIVEYYINGKVMAAEMCYNGWKIGLVFVSR